jgi:hypothetical protein
MHVKRRKETLTASITGLLIILSSPYLAENSSTTAYAESSYLTKKQTDTSANQRPHDTSEHNLSNTASKEKRIFSKLGVHGLSTEFVGQTGYRNDDFKWSIAGDLNGNNPNVLSELTWDDLGIITLTFKNKTIYRGVYFRGYFQYGWIISGDVQDSDFLGDNRTLEFSRSNNSADDGDTKDASAGIGYQFDFGTRVCGFTPLIGYSYHVQNLKITDGNQTITFFGGPPLGPFSGLDSTYEAEWKGPWVGFDVVFRSLHKKSRRNDFEFGLGFEYHWADYDAEANWNLRTDFAHPKSFEHDADGNGFVVSADWNVFFTKNWALNVNANYQDWDTDSGVERTFFADGTTFDTRLNDVDWDSFAIMLGLTYRF